MPWSDCRRSLDRCLVGVSKLVCACKDHCVFWRAGGGIRAVDLKTSRAMAKNERWPSAKTLALHPCEYP